MNENKFEFTYRAPTENERRTVEGIKKQYEEKGGGSLEELKRLDKKVKSGATVPALIVGIIGALIFGTGLSMVLEFGLILWGILVCVISLPFIIFAPFLHKILFKRGKEKHGEEILRLCEELLKK
jgi:hypothetical protein